MNEASDTRILLGRIGAAHGIRGEVLVQSFAADPADIAAYGPLAGEDGVATYTLTVVRVIPKGVVARVKGIADRTAAEKLRGIGLYIDRAKLPMAADGEFYHTDLIGLDAVAPDGTLLGHIIAMQNFGAGDLIEIRLAGTTKTELIPFTDTCVPTVDLALRRAVVLRPVPSDTDGPDQEREPPADDEGGDDDGDPQSDPDQAAT